MRVTLDLQIDSACKDLPERKEITRWARAVLKENGAPDTHLCIRIVDEAESQQLNETYRKKTGPTNVLAFPSEIPAGLQSSALGDIIICAPVVAREAAAQHKPLQAHWAHMIVHGIMHLRGYTHDTDATAHVMENMEIKVMQSLGFENPYG